MKRWGFLILALSLGLNVGLLWMHFRAGDDGDFRHRLHARNGEGRRAGMERVEGTPAEREERRRAFLERRFDQLAEELALTDEQRKIFREVHEEYLPLIFENRDAEHARREAMMQRLRSASTKEEVQEIVRERAEVQREIDSLVVDAMFRQLSALDQEQRDKYLAQFPWGRELGDGHPPGPGPGRGPR